MSLQTDIKMFNVLSLETIPGNLVNIRNMYDPDSRVSRYLEAKVDFEMPDEIIYCGHGEIYRPGRCGKFTGYVGCEHCGSIRPLVEHCGKLTCPVCLRMAASKKGYHVAKEKFEPFMQFIATETHFNTMTSHYCLSPAKEVPIDGLAKYGIKWYNSAVELNKRLWSKENYATKEKRKETFKFVQNILDNFLYGYVIVFHPGRFYDETKKEKLVWSPHFHIIGYAHNDIGYRPGYLPDDTYFKIGCVFTRISSLRTIKDISACMSYLLTHTWIHTYKRWKKRRFWKNPNSQAKLEYNQKLLDDYESYVDEAKRSNMRAEYFIDSERFKIKIKSFDEWLYYPGVHSSCCYQYGGYMKPHLTKVLQSTMEKEVLECDVCPQGLMCEVESGVLVLDTDSDRMFSMSQLKEFNINIFLYDNKKYLTVITDDVRLGYFMYRKYLKKRIHVDIF